MKGLLHHPPQKGFALTLCKLSGLVRRCALSCLNGVLKEGDFSVLMAQCGWLGEGGEGLDVDSASATANERPCAGPSDLFEVGRGLDWARNCHLYIYVGPDKGCVVCHSFLELSVIFPPNGFPEYEACSRHCLQDCVG